MTLSVIMLLPDGKPFMMSLEYRRTKAVAILAKLTTYGTQGLLLNLALGSIRLLPLNGEILEYEPGATEAILNKMLELLETQGVARWPDWMGPQPSVYEGQKAGDWRHEGSPLPPLEKGGKKE